MAIMRKIIVGRGRLQRSTQSLPPGGWNVPPDEDKLNAVQQVPMSRVSAVPQDVLLLDKQELGAGARDHVKLTT